MIDGAAPGRCGPSRRVPRGVRGGLAVALALAATGIYGQSALQDELAAELDRVERAHQQLQRLELQPADTAADGDQQALDRAVELRVGVSNAVAGSDAVDRLFDEVVREVVAARGRLRRALDELAVSSAVPRFSTSYDLEALRGTTLAAQVAELESRIDELRQLERRLAKAERGARWQSVQRRWEVVRRLNDVRILALNRTSPRKRARVLGFSREGIAQLRREVDHLSLSVAVYLQDRLRLARATRDLPGDFVAVGTLAWVSFKVLLVVAAYVFLLRRGPRIHAAIHRSVAASTGRVKWRWRLETLLRAGAVVAPWLLLLGLLYLLPRVLGPAASWPEIRLAHRLIVLYALYRLSIDAIVAAVVALVRRYRFEITPARTTKLLRSVRTILRVVFAVLVLLTLATRFLGAGYLYHVVFRLALLALALALLIVFRRWREDISDAYLELGGSGRLRGRVEQARSRWYGGFVAAAALLMLAGRALWRLTRDFAMGFDQTRRALAFLFRRRVEKQAERTGYAEIDRSRPLPPALAEALSEDPVTDDRLAVDFFPGLDELHQAIADWRESATGGSFLLTGDIGVGRTSWLARVHTDELPLQRVTFDRRIDSDAELARTLGKGLELEPPERTADLRARLLELPRRVIVIDRGQNLFLGRVGGYAGFESFMSLVDGTAHHVFWIVAFSQLAWEHIAAVHPHLAGFRGQLLLEPWPEERIHELIRKRAEAAGFEPNYDDLALDSVDGLSYEERTMETEQRYARLLWDHSLGMPRSALHYWRRSLVLQDAGRVRVRLFRPPPVETLERAGDVPLFMLAAIVVHESLTVREISVVTRFPEPLCRIHVTRLEDLGVIRRGGIRCWLTSYWQPVVYRLLKRRNLLSD